MEHCLPKIYQPSHPTPLLRSQKKRNESIDPLYKTDYQLPCYNNLKELAGRVQKLVLNDWSVVTCTENVVRIWKVDVPYIIPTYDIQIDDSLGFTLNVCIWVVSSRRSYDLQVLR